MALMNGKPAPKTGWTSLLSKSSIAAMLFLTVTGLAIAYAPFHATMQWSVLLHTMIGLVTLIPLIWYTYRHWEDYKRYNLSDAVLLGYVSGLAFLVCLVSGVVVT
jgi:hypothetical protein